MNTTPKQGADVRRRRRIHSDEFKADAVAACIHGGASMAAIALDRGVNANLLRRWVRETEERGDALPANRAAAPARSAPTFVPLQLPTAAAPAASSAIHIEVRRGAAVISVTWPTEAAAECAGWMRELLR